jgi:peptidyl-prolyl cis-trans isomerase D
MTMMISKFHKLIQSRLLWGAFLIIIVFSFVVWGMVWPSQMDKMDQANAAGTLDGAPVTHGEYRSAYLSTYLARALTLGREVDNTPESEAVLRRLSWQRLATLREVSKLGVAATDQELIGALQANFAESNGVYNPQRYQAFLQNVIRPLNFTTAQFEQHIREEIAIQKLGSLIGRQAHVTPLEIRRTFETLLDTFTIEYALVQPEAVEKDVKVADEDARKLYDADPAAFTVPEQREVSYVAFPIADYQDDTAEISDEDVQDYYELHIEEYTTKSTGEDGKPRETVAELDTVKEGIVEALRGEAALAKADAAATELAFKAIPDRDGTVPDFAAEVEKAGRKADKLAPFSRSDLPVADAGPVFAAAAFELAPNAFDRVSAPVAGQNNVYVIYLEKEIASRVPSFEEAKDRVLAAAKQKAVADAISAKATAVKEAAEAGLAAGKTFAQAVADTGIQVATAEPFTGLSGSSSSNRMVQALVQAVVGYNQGEVAEPSLTDDGLVVAYLKARTPADEASYDSYRDEIAASIRNRRAQGLFRDWQVALLAPERFTDLQRPAAATDDQEEGGDEAVEEVPDGLTDEEQKAAAAAQEAM